MVPINRNRERFIALFVLGVLLLLPPVLLIFNRPVRVLGIPVLYLHIFLTWAVLIAGAARLARRISADDWLDPPQAEDQADERPPHA